MTTRRRLPDATGTAIRPVKLGHVVLRVSNLKRSREWYLRVLEGRPAFENEMLCFLTYDDEHHRIGLVERPDPGSDDAQQRLEHISFTYLSLGELLATYRRLAQHGIRPYWPINHGPTISFYYKDPDGNRLELQYDVFERNEDLDAFFASGAYLENFMGIVFDPEQMIARFEAGEPLAEITARPKLPEGKTPWDMHIP
jgi:catechol 2,3-dioxygenase-like lactoylglutathione lyase family enzyme